jgi:hypothetical protein
MSVVVEHLGHVTQLTLDRQDAANAINIEMAIGIAEAIDAFAADPNARVLVVTGPAATARILWPSSRRRGVEFPVALDDGDGTLATSLGVQRVARDLPRGCVGCRLADRRGWWWRHVCRRCGRLRSAGRMIGA